MRFGLKFALSMMLTTLIYLPQSFAQIDPSSALLLERSSNKAPARDVGLDSGRYTVRPRSETVRRESVRDSARKSTPIVDPNAPETVESTWHTPPMSTPLPTFQATPAPVVISNSPAVEEEVTVVAPVQDYRDERRTTMLELSFAPGYIYNGSDSNYVFRHYFTSAPTILVDAKVWLNPGFALNTSYLGTLSGHVTDSVDGSRVVSATQQWFTLGIRGRKFFGGSRMSPTLEYGLDYTDYEFRVPSDSVRRAKLNSTGAKLLIEVEVPATPWRAWTFGGFFAPKLKHRESSSIPDFASGTSYDANSLGVSIGSKYRFDRSNIVFWKFSYSVEKDLFSGSASTTDTVTGVKPSGVAVTNSFSGFQLGFTWGD